MTFHLMGLVSSSSSRHEIVGIDLVGFELWCGSQYKTMIVVVVLVDLFVEHIEPTQLLATWTPKHVYLQQGQCGSSHPEIIRPALARLPPAAREPGCNAIGQNLAEKRFVLLSRLGLVAVFELSCVAREPGALGVFVDADDLTLVVGPTLAQHALTKAVIRRL
jgi:hypothetical protein